MITLKQIKDLARSRKLLAAYLPDHASKSRLIIPGYKPYLKENSSDNSTNGLISTNVPYMIQLKEGGHSLNKNILNVEHLIQIIFGQRSYQNWLSSIAIVSSKQEEVIPCKGTLECIKDSSERLFENALAGLNRIIGKVISAFAKAF